MHRTTEDGMSPTVSVAITLALSALETYVQCLTKPISSINGRDSVSIEHSQPVPPSIAAAIAYLLSNNGHPNCEIGFIFLMHVTMLDMLPLYDRAQYNFSSCLDPSLNRILHDKFLPHIYYRLNKSKVAQFDCIDGRLFTRLIWEFTNPEFDLNWDDLSLQSTRDIWKQVITHFPKIHLDWK